MKETPRFFAYCLKSFRTPVHHMETKLYAALYIRLSVEDGDGAESGSISTQRKILRHYAEEKDFTIYGEYVDDGYSGTNLDRPAFQRMLQAIEAGHINVVITKDLSRLGRNSARTADLLDEYFPAHRVRYISVTDGYDSGHLNSGAVLAAPLMMAMHEMYARDTSNKIRSALRAKMQAGEFIGSFAPFGYEKDPENHNHLVPDPIAAPLVQRIFLQAQTGKTPTQIAAALNSETIPSPLDYRHSKSGTLDAASSVSWQAATVRKILKNPVYLGHLTQGKTSKLSFKNKASISAPKSDWVVSENTHTPLIEPDCWDTVQHQLRLRTQPRTKGFVNIFSGIARCADCGAGMSTVGARSRNSVATLACGAYKLHGKQACSNHHIPYETLYNTVLQALNSVLKQYDAEQLMRQILPALNKAATMPFRKQDHDRLHEEKKQLIHKIEQLYDDKYSGRIMPEYFEHLLAQYKKREKAICHALSNPPLYQRAFSLDCLLEQLHDLLQPSTLNARTLALLIDRITISQGDYSSKTAKMQRIDIYLRF